MSEKYPLFPELPEEGNKEAQLLIDKFKEKLSKVAESIIGDFYCDVACYIQSDSWANFRNELLDGFQNYDNRKIQGEYDFKKIRQAIFKEHRDELIKDLNQDMVEKIATLEKHIEIMKEANRGHY